MKNEKVAVSGKGGFGTAGIWIKASYVNHSCVGNCRRSFIGDMQILRATTDMQAGTELMFPYQHPQELDLYEDVQPRLKHWGFTCDCALCQARRATPAAQVQKRKKLLKSLQVIIDMRGRKPLDEGGRLVEEMKQTYPASHPAEVPRLELHSFCFAMAAEYQKQFESGRATADMFLEGLRALGYEITSVWPTKGTPTTTIRFEIERWGIVNNMVPWAFGSL